MFSKTFINEIFLDSLMKSAKDLSGEAVFGGCQKWLREMTQKWKLQKMNLKK
jgi:hypothetical protein